MKKVSFAVVAALGIAAGSVGQGPLVAQSATAQYSIADLGSLGAYPHARALNNSGHVVGDSRLSPAGATHATLFVPGLGISDLGLLPGGSFSAAVQVNEAGLVAGVADIAGGIRRGFVWTPSRGMTDIGSLTPGLDVRVGGMNGSGQLCGGSDVAVNTEHAFVWSSDEGMTDLGTLGGATSICTDLNDAGQATGHSATTYAGLHAFRYEPGTNGAPGVMRDLGTLGGWLSLASAINSSGVIVGRSHVSGTTDVAFYDLPGVGMMPINIGAWSSAFLINDAGLVAGTHAVGQNWWEYKYHGFVYRIGSGAAPVDIGTLGGNNSYISAMNQHGVIVGRSNSASGSMRAFIYRDGTMTDLNSLIPADSGLTLTEATDINDKGWILAWGQLPNFEYRQYLLKPGPFFTFAGFLAPVEGLPTVNLTKPGVAVPVKFSLGGDHGLGVVASSTSVPTACDSSAPVDTIEETTTAGASTLSYDPATATYKYTWKTDRAWSGCRYFLLTLSDGNTYSAKFQFSR